MLFALVLLLFAPHAEAHPGPHAARAGILPKSWDQPSDHPVRALFRRQAPLPEVGTAEWRALYPTNDRTPEATIPQAWRDALAAAVAAGRIPDIPVPLLVEELPDYGAANPESPLICSSTFQCRATDDIWDGPDGTIGLSVDDGPHNLPGASARLYDYLREQNQKVTHFMIGSNILKYPELFNRAFEELGNDIAVHTWSHRMQSTLSNEAILADLGWTIQIIHDLTGGRLTRYWRPPYGEADNRVRAIAREVFGMTTVIWNSDTQDWGLKAGSETIAGINARVEGWLAGPRSPGLIVLQHEIDAEDIDSFVQVLPILKASTWQVSSIAELYEDEVGWYLNAQNNRGPVIDMEVASGPNPTGAGGARPSAASNSTSIATSSTRSSSSPRPSTTRTTTITPTQAASNRSAGWRLEFGLQFAGLIAAFVGGLLA